MKLIEILITSDGQISLQTRGFQGPECRDASRDLEVALGKRFSEQLTTEFHETQPTSTDLHERY